MHCFFSVVIIIFIAFKQLNFSPILFIMITILAINFIKFSKSNLFVLLN